MHTRYLSLLLLILASILTPSPSQAREIPLDTLLMRLYDRAATLMGAGEYDSAQVCFDRAFATPGVRQSSAYPILLNEQATLLVYVGRLDSALVLKKSVLPYLPRVADLEKHVSVYSDLGLLYHRANQQDSSLYYYNKALDAARTYGDKSWIASLTQNLAVFYHNLGHYADAEKYIDYALENVLQTDDAPTTFSVWQIRAAIKAKNGHTGDSGTSLRRAWQLASGPEGRAEWQLRCIPSLYSYFRQQGHTDSIRPYIALGNKLLAQLPPRSISAIGFIQTRATVHYEQQRYAEALTDLLYLYTNPTGTEKKSLLEKIATCYYHTGRPRRAFAYMDSARMWADTLARQHVASQMAELKVKYESQEKELEIALLHGQILQHQTRVLQIAIVLISSLALLLLLVLWLRHKQKNAERKLVQLRQEKELEATRRYIEGMEEECRYFAKELHDGIANDLLALEMKASFTRQESLAGSIKEVRENVRILSHELIPPEFDHYTLDEILAYYTRFLSENTGIRITYNAGISPAQTPLQIPDRTSREVYRILQEVVMNILKHTDASCIHILFTADAQGEVRLQITDNGTAVATAAREGRVGHGIGLRTIGDRAKAIRATICATSEEHENHFVLNFKLHTHE